MIERFEQSGPPPLSGCLRNGGGRRFLSVRDQCFRKVGGWFGVQKRFWSLLGQI
jgi:hypothetical protein